MSVTKGVLLASALLPLLAARASAQTDWDDPGRRSGFVIGFGAGPGLTQGATFAATNRLLVTVGAGVGSWTELCLWFCGTGELDETGFGAMAGVGYEFADLWVVDLSVNFAALDHPGNVLNVSMKIGVLSH